ncbi:MAG: chromate efflux transporter [Candidatus Binataceae bacterium]|jgi:chromate transporter
MIETPVDSAAPIVSDDRRTRLWELAMLFLRLGTIAFGGPAAHIAMMEDEVVRRRGWVSHEEFLDMVGACNLIPGPNSTEMAIHIGHRRAGFTGLAVAGACFIVPAVAITIVVAWAYVRFGSMPQVAGALYGIKPVIIAVVVQALWRLWPRAARTRSLIAITIAATAAALLGFNEIAILFAAGLITIGAAIVANRPRLPGGFAAPSIIAMPAASAATTAVASAATVAVTAAAPFSLGAMFLIFVKIGAVLFGSGYVLLAFLQADFVDRLHWLTRGQLLDAVAVGQFTPGPVFCTATFIGYLLGSTTGSLVATVGIFIPAFLFVAISGPLLPRLRRSPIAGAFLDGVNAASLALMIAVTWDLSREAMIDATTVVLAILGAITLIRFRLNSVWLILVGGIVGALVSSAPRL